MAVGLYSGVSGLALGIGLYKNVSGLWGGASGLINGFGGSGPFPGASLYLDFLTPPLDSRITFSRGSNATLVDATGKITYAPANLLTYSEQFDNAAWTKTNATITANSTEAPDGTLTADTFTATTANGVIRNDPAKIGTMINSIYVKRKTGTGAVQILDAAGSYTTVTVTSEWTRVSATALATGASLFGVRLVVSGDEIYIWGAQAEQVTYQTTPSTYVATTASAYYGPRFDYDPVTLAPKGLLIEEARTNLLTYSEQFDNAAWIKQTVPPVSVVANVTQSPDGTVNADILRPATSASTFHFVSRQSLTLTNTAQTATVYLKAGGYDFAELIIGSDGAYTKFASAYFNLATGTYVSSRNTSYTVTSYSITPVGSGWYRCSLTVTTDANSTGVFTITCGSTSNPVASFTGNGTSGIYIYGAQLEAGSFATSYIPTVASTVTRSADVATMTGTNFSSWYNPLEGTFVANYSTYAADAVSTKAIVSANDGTGNNRIYMYLATNAAPAELVNNGGVTQATVSNAAIANGAVTKSAMIYRTDDFAIGTNGGTLATDTLGTVPTVTQLTIGNSSSISQLNGHIRQIAYYNTRLPNAQLQTLTAPSLATTLSLSFTNQAYTVGV